MLDSDTRTFFCGYVSAFERLTVGKREYLPNEFNTMLHQLTLVARVRVSDLVTLHLEVERIELRNIIPLLARSVKVSTLSLVYLFFESVQYRANVGLSL